MIRRGIVALGVDPPSRVRVRGLSRAIVLPFSHQMPVYRGIYPRYDALLGDLADYIRENDPLTMVDVGANVGDSILAANPAPGDAFIAFEPHPAFLEFLRINVESLSDVTVSAIACGASKGNISLGDASAGTAGSRPLDGSGQSVASTTLDVAIEQAWGGRLPNFVKIDTDGFDTDVIQGATDVLARRATWLLYECDIRLTRGGVERHLATLALLRTAGYVSAAAFNNTGEFSARIDLDEGASWRALMSTQSATGPVYYHDLLLAPTELDLTVFLRKLPVEASAA